jgi:hypothetical protein
MNKKNLNILGCSGSIAVALLTANSATANPSNSSNKEYVFRAPEVNKTQMQQINFQQEDSSYSADRLEDLEGEKAINLYGCDCSGCRNLVTNVNPAQKFLQENI